MGRDQEIILSDGTRLPAFFRKVKELRNEKEKLIFHWLNPTGNGWSSLAEASLLYEYVGKKNIHTTYECGTRRGWSACWMALSLKERITGGKVYTFDIEPWVGIEEDVGLSNHIVRTIGKFHETVPSFLEKRPDAPILIYIDGDHSYEGVSADFYAVAPFLRKGDVVFFNDVQSVKRFRVSEFLAELEKSVIYDIKRLHTQHGTAILELK